MMNESEKEMAARLAERFTSDVSTRESLVEFAGLIFSEMKATQEPAAWMTENTGNGQYAMWAQKPTSDYWVQNSEKLIPLYTHPVTLAGTIEALRCELERERMRLTACGVVALSNTKESAKNARAMHDDYRSASCDDVANAVDKQMALREQLAAMAAERDEAQQNWNYAEEHSQKITHKLAACQAREQQLRKALEYALPQLGYGYDAAISQSAFESINKAIDLTKSALTLPSNDTALKAWGAKLLRDAAENIACTYDESEPSRFVVLRMADELEEKK